MKKIYLFILFLASVTLGFTACQEDALDPLTGKYQAPAEFTLTNLFAKQAQKSGSNRIFTLKISTNGVNATYNESTYSYTYTGTGKYLSIDLIGKEYYLTPGTYTIAGHESAKSGNYIAGYDMDFGGGLIFENWGTCWFNINNGTESGIKITGGTLYVTKNDDNYTITGKLILSDNTFINIDYTGVIVYEPDPIVYTYTKEITKPYTWTPDGTTINSVPGTQLNKITIKADDYPVAYFEIVTEENPASLAGTYTIKNVTDNERAICQGQYFNLSWFGMTDTPIESGSYLLDDAEKLFIRSGSVNITDNSGTLNINATGLLIQDIATQMQFGTLTTPRNINYQGVSLSPGGNQGGTFPNLYSASALDNTLFGGTGYTITLKLAESALTVNTEQGTYGATYSYSGSGRYLSLDFKTASASLTEGIYNVADNTTAVNGNCIAGYPSPFGSGFFGSVVGNVTNGTVTETVVSGGSVTVTQSGGNYNITFNLTTASGTVQGSFSGAVTL